MERVQRKGVGRRTEDGAEHEVCGAHSGTVAGIRGLYALLSILIGLLGVQMIFQIPSIRMDILQEVKGVTARIVELEKKDIEFANKIALLESKIESNGRNGSHP